MYLRLIILGKNVSYREGSGKQGDDPYRKKGYGTEALGAIFDMLSRKDTAVHLPDKTKVILEIERDRPWLVPWYAKFGFVEVPGPNYEYIYMEVPLHGILFPLKSKTFT